MNPIQAGRRVRELKALLPKTANEVLPGTSHELQAIRDEILTLGGSLEDRPPTCPLCRHAIHGHD